MAADTMTELDREKLGGAFAGSLILHAGIVAAIGLYAIIAGHLHGAEWGNNQAPGAIQATLVSAAPTIPLPQDAPPTPNVLATEQPSPAPAPPQPKEVPAPQPEAIPIPAKQPVKEKKAPDKPTPPSPKHAQPTPQQHRAQFGEAPPTQIAHAMAPTQVQDNPVNVAGGGQGFNYPYYVGIIQRKVREAWYIREVDPHTRVSSQVKVIFSISRAGVPSNARISQSSGSPTLDSSALRAVQRIDSFGPLPNGYSGSNVSVEYTFSYDLPSQ